MKPAARPQGLPCSTRLMVLLLTALTVTALPSRIAHAQKDATYVISGRVVRLDGGPVPKARLSATSDAACSDGREPRSEAEADGHFQLRVPCPGVWRLTGEAKGFPKQSYEQHDAFSTGIALTVAHTLCEIVFRLAGSSSIQGTVLDEVGDPVRDAKVFLLMPGAAGAEAPRSIDQTITDDRGMYDFADVATGGYEVAIQVQPWYAVAAQSSSGFGGQSGASDPSLVDPSLDMTYPITYYPGATDASSALTIEVAPDATQQADIHLSPVPSVHVVIPGSGRTVLGFGGSRRLPRGVPSPAIQQLSSFGPLKFEPTSVSVMSDGSLEVGGFSPGEYTLARGRSRDDSNPQPFTVSKDANHLVPLSDSVPRQEPKADATGSVNGTVELAQQPCAGALLLLVPIAGGGIERQQSNTDGSFRFDKVPSGKYILLGIDQGWSIDLSDRQAVSAYMARGLPIDVESTVTLHKPLQAQSR